MRAAYFYLMTDDAERVRLVAPRHATYWRERVLRGYRGGPFADRSGGLITFEVESAEEATRLVASDPFVTERLIVMSWLKEWCETEP